MNDDIRCATCGGDGVWCGQHATPDGCDCDDADRNLPCEDCGGTGQPNDGDEDTDEDEVNS